MSWTAMADVPNPIIVDAAGTAGIGYVLKAYLPGTTTTTSIAIDSSGSSPQSTITANAEGKWEVSGNEIIPHIDRKHKWGIFATAAHATANTPFYMGPFDNIEQAVAGNSIQATNNIIIFETVADMVASTSLSVGDHVRTLGYTTIEDGGGNDYDIVAAATGTADGGLYIDLATHQAKGLFPGGRINLKQFGAVCDGSTDDTAAIQAAQDAIEAAGGGTLFFPNGSYYINGGRIEWDASDITWLGEGLDSKLIWSIATDEPTDNWGMVNIHGTNTTVINRVKVKDLYFDFGSNKSAVYDQYHRGLHIYNCDHIEITGCYFKGGQAEMVGVNNRGSGGCKYLTVTNCVFEDYNQNGLNPNAIYQTISNNIFRNAATSGKIEIGGQNWSFTGNVVLDHLFGLDLSNPTDFEIVGNTFISTKTGVQFSNQTAGVASYRGVIAHNTFRTDAAASGEYGINITRGSSGGFDNEDINVIGNVLYGYWKGIRITSNDGGVIANNVVDGNGVGTTGIEIGSAGSTVNVVLDGNISRDNTTDYNISLVGAGEIAYGLNHATNGVYTVPGTIESEVSTTATSGTGEDNLKLYTLPANTLPLDHGLQIFAAGTSAGTAGNKTVRFYFGTTLIATLPAFTTADEWHMEITMWSFGTALQAYTIKGYNGGALTLCDSWVTSTELTTSSKQILFTGECSNGADALYQEALIIKKF